MTVPVLSGASALAAALLDVAVLIEQAGAGGLSVTCYPDSTSILVSTCAGRARDRAALVAALAGAARCWQSDIAGERPAAWLEAAGRAGGTVIEVRTPLAVTTAPGGTLAAGPDGQRDVVATGQQPPPGWRWVTELDDEPAASQEVT